MSDEIVREFLVESNENLDLLDRELVQFEKNPANRETLASVFRTIHTIKGTCGFLGFTKLEAVAHVGENLLSKLRDGEITFHPELATALLRMVDAIRQMLSSVEERGNEGERDDGELINLLTRLQQGVASIPSSPGTGASGDKSKKSHHAAGSRDKNPAKTDEQHAEHATAAKPAVPEKRQEETEIREERSESGAMEPAESVQGQAGGRAVISESSIRVDVILLDKLMNLVGELVLARNQILQFTNSHEDPALLAPSQRLNLITSELQGGVMKTRMQPIGNIWSKFPRTVRDVATACGKEIRIEMEGKDTELDKTIIESVKDPLMHIVRNSADHGIETPEKRLAAGKPREGLLLLRAFHEGGQVNIEISDDGAGLDPEKIARKAVEKGLLSPEQAAKLTEREAVNLIFLPGFSTAEKVTNVSGRGVGMDVVRTNIEKIGGTVDVESKAGQGTTVRMKIPLTLAIIPALIVTDGGARFAIPQVNLLELVRIEEDKVKTAVEYVHGAPVYRLRGRLLPLVYLAKELRTSSEGSPESSNAAANIVVLQAGESQFGLVVDQINDSEEIVVKPLGRRLKSVKIFAGATIRGDGKVALILDVLGVAQRTSLVSEHRDRALIATDAEAQKKRDEKQTFLIFAGPDEARMALPLDALARLEEFPVSQVERSGSQPVIQYRGSILPLIYLKTALQERRGRRRHPEPAESTAPDGNLQVLVCNHEGRAAGVVVEQILDIVEDRAEVRTPATRAGVLYGALIQNRVTEMINLDTILSSVNALHEHEDDPVKVGH